MLTASLSVIDGKLDILVSGQRLILEELFSLRGDVQSGVQSIHDHLLAMQDTLFRQDFAQLQEIYCEVLRRIGMYGTPHFCHQTSHQKQCAQVLLCTWSNQTSQEL